MFEISKKYTLYKAKQKRIYLIELFEKYKEIDNLKNKWVRFKKNSQYKSIVYLLLVSIFGIAINLITFFQFRKCLVLIFSLWSILFVLLIINQYKNLGEYYKECVELRDKELCNILMEKNISHKNIKYIIDYYTLELDFPNTIYKESKVLNSFASVWAKLFYVLLGAFIPKLMEDKFQPEFEIFILLIAITIFIGIILLFLLIYSHLNRTDQYLNKIRIFIIELKQIELLNKLK